MQYLLSNYLLSACRVLYTLLGDRGTVGAEQKQFLLLWIRQHISSGCEVFWPHLTFIARVDSDMLLLWVGVASLNMSLRPAGSPQGMIILIRLLNSCAPLLSLLLSEPKLDLLVEQAFFKKKTPKTTVC